MTATPLPIRVLFLLAMSAGGLGIAIVMPEMTTKSLLFLVVGVAGAVLVVMAGRPKEVLLAGFIIALTYNRQYFSFDALLGGMGAQGFYWIPADIFLVGLLAIWLGERAVGQARPPANGQTFAGAALPALVFLVPCVFSALLAERQDVAMSELGRVVRMVIVLGWLQRNMTRSLWYTAVCALAFAMLLQAALGTLQVVLRADRNLLSIFGVQGEVILDDEGGVDLLENRARGTLGHPNTLAPYILVMLPAALGVLIYSRIRLTRLLALAVLLVGVAGMVATKSRGPIVLMPIGLLAVAATAVFQRRLSVKAVLGTLVIALVLLAAIAIPYAEAIRERVMGDFGRSVEFRTEYNEAAIAIWNDAPLTGIGLNNSVMGLQRYSPMFHWLTQDLASRIGDAAVRATAPVHNVYLLVLAETGILGLAGFVFLIGSVMWRAVRGAAYSQDGTRGLCIGIAAGMGTQYVQQTIDFSQWADPSFYTLAVLLALLGVIPAMRPVIR